jgi:hypothetical protein
MSNLKFVLDVASQLLLLKRMVIAVENGRWTNEMIWLGGKIAQQLSQELSPNLLSRYMTANVGITKTSDCWPA